MATVSPTDYIIGMSVNVSALCSARITTSTVASTYSVRLLACRAEVVRQLILFVGTDDFEYSRYELRMVHAGSRATRQAITRLLVYSSVSSSDRRSRSTHLLCSTSSRSYVLRVRVNPPFSVFPSMPGSTAPIPRTWHRQPSCIMTGAP